MKKLFILLAIVVMGLSSCSGGDNSSNDCLTIEKVSKAVMKGEEERLPLKIQSMPDVSNVTIDSIHLFVTEEPMEGYLYTTWESKSKKTSIIVAISDIRKSEERDGYIEWQSDWNSAYEAFIMKRLGEKLDSIELPKPPTPPVPIHYAQ